jgi:hypothetical protein
VFAAATRLPGEFVKEFIERAETGMARGSAVAMASQEA